MPNAVPSTQMSARLRAKIGLMMGDFHLTNRQCQSYLQSVWQLHFSLGAIKQVQAHVSTALRPLHEQIHRYVVNQPVAHADETHYQREKQTRYLWWACSAGAAVYFQSQQSGR